MNIRIITFFLLFAPFVFSSVFTVKKDGSGDFTSIQQAVDAASNFDEIIVYPGTYEESLKITKETYLHSSDPFDSSVVESTIIYSTNSNVSTINFEYFYLGKYTNTILTGFTIKNGLYGVYCDNNNKIKIRYNIVEDNWNDGIHGVDGLICSNIIRNNIDDGISYSHGIIEHNTIYNNRSDGIYGCNNIIRYNNIYENWSDGIHSSGGNDGMISENQVHNNKSGGINYCNATIVSNHVYQNQGCGIYDCDNDVIYNKIYDNSGSGISYCGGLIEHNTIVSNIASYSGGGLYNCNGTIRNNLIIFNRAQYGGGLYNCKAYIANNTIAYNFGGGIENAVGVIYNCIIWGNDGSQIADGGIPMNCCVQGGTNTNNNCITNNPQFISNANFRLQDNSLCIDTGFNLPDINTWTDLDGNDRVYNTVVDIGCYELTPEPFLPYFLLAVIVISGRILKY